MRWISRYKRCMTIVLAGMMLLLTQPEAALAKTAGHWEQQDNQWYYRDAYGNRCTGWIKVDGKDYYMAADGHCLMNTVTPDGYYVSPSGEWFVRSTTILDIDFTSYTKVPNVKEDWASRNAMKYLRDEIGFTFEERDIKITDTSIEYVRGDNEEVLMGIYKNTENGSYRLKLAIGLNKKSTSTQKMETYDYAVFRALLYQITSTPEILEDAVYNSWQEDNRWQIKRNQTITVGDSQVKYSAGDGYGCYYIYPILLEHP